jgi:microcystin-dependent protein
MKAKPALDRNVPQLVRKVLLVGIPAALLVGGGAVAYAAGLLTWSDGETLKSADLNGNFAYLQSEISTLIPPGTILPYGGPQAAAPDGGALPQGWLLCDGSAVSRSTYAALFTAIGINFGGGDGVNTFNLPDLRGRTVVGSGTGPGFTPRTIGAKLGEESHLLSVNEMPSHAHTVYPQGAGNQAGQPFLYGPGNNCGIQCSPNSGFVGSFGGAITDPAGGGAAHNVMQPSAVVNYLIRF